jgi:transcriptional regulator with XRE-family HTH domain
MRYATDHIAAALRNARAAKGMSQRSLSELAGVPQSHISKIESGAVDLRVSSLVELARVLDLELMLVPRKSVPAVNSIVRSTEHAPQPGHATSKEIRRLQARLDKLLHKYPTNTELAQFQRVVRDLKNFQLSETDVNKLRDASRVVDMVMDSKDVEGLHRTLIEVKNIRNAAAHRGSLPMSTTVRPAYSLEEDDGHGE